MLEHNYSPPKTSALPPKLTHLANIAKAVESWFVRLLGSLSVSSHVGDSWAKCVWLYQCLCQDKQLFGLITFDELFSNDNDDYSDQDDCLCAIMILNSIYFQLSLLIMMYILPFPHQFIN